ncbi:hypothetical protein CTA2_10703 [Colletotrichum tanaceti]|uniref:Uncharacterized protein n=1 Tax=Colletotrichum tanaceti TaxID=1306861 RepID=A0A4U6X2L8_9PEZI|nr:hypothetical protein CTA2_10703 [Colletotrichum tanaceti]TKW49621.1 hypothetical protein CTA1_11161 [Colletotrichum tanaceti]
MLPRPFLLHFATRLANISRGACTFSVAHITTPIRTRPSPNNPHTTPLHTTAMSWMDSWSRPSKSQATPAPFYLLPNGDATSYCRTCGRVISSRKATAASKAASKAPKTTKTTAAETKTEPKYCSSRCRSQKPGRLDKELEQAFVRFLQGEDEVEGGKDKVKRVKGDTRVLVACDAVESKVFGDRQDPNKVYGRKKNRASRVIGGNGASEEDEDEAVGEQSRRRPDGDTKTRHDNYNDNDNDNDHDPGAEVIDEMLGLDRSKSAVLPLVVVDDADDPHVQASLAVRSGTRVRPPQTRSQVNGSVGGEKGRAERVEETDEMRSKRAEGQRRAHEREMVRCAARRGVVFGFLVDGRDGSRRKCEAVMQGKVVEPSYAKGDWAVRWRED